MGKWENCPKLSHFSLILLFPINFTHFLNISQNVLLAISHVFPFFSIPPSFPPAPPFSPIFSFSPFFQAPAARWLIWLRLTRKRVGGGG